MAPVGRKPLRTRSRREPTFSGVINDSNAFCGIICGGDDKRGIHPSTAGFPKGMLAQPYEATYIGLAMNILAVETCVEPGSIALLREGNLPEVEVLPHGWHSTALH